MRLKFHSSDLLDPQNITLHIPLIDQIYEKMFYGLGGFIFLPKWKISKTVLFYMPWGTSKVILLFEIPKFAFYHPWLPKKGKFWPEIGANCTLCCISTLQHPSLVLWCLNQIFPRQPKQFSPEDVDLVRLKIGEGDPACGSLSRAHLQVRSGGLAILPEQYTANYILLGGWPKRELCSWKHTRQDIEMSVWRK